MSINQPGLLCSEFHCLFPTAAVAPSGVVFPHSSQKEIEKWKAIKEDSQAGQGVLIHLARGATRRQYL